MQVKPFVHPSSTRRVQCLHMTSGFKVLYWFMLLRWHIYIGISEDWVKFHNVLSSCFYLLSIHTIICNELTVLMNQFISRVSIVVHVPTYPQLSTHHCYMSWHLLHVGLHFPFCPNTVLHCPCEIDPYHPMCMITSVGPFHDEKPVRLCCGDGGALLATTTWRTNLSY